MGSSEERDVECVISINAFFGSALLFWLTQRTSEATWAEMRLRMSVWLDKRYAASLDYAVCRST